MLTRVLTVMLALLATGCSSLGYYGQAVSGHLDIMSRREPVETILADPEQDEVLKTRLLQAQAYRDFASDTLALPVNDSYRSYVALDRPYVVWSVFAAEEFSLKPRTWCFWVVGCVAYRGYFAEADAQAEADTLADAGYDVYVGGTTAYSTLGWFDDPLVSPMFNRGDLGLAGLIFHELAHQQLYVNDDSEFNEAFASTVEQAGVRRWLSLHEPERMEAYERFLQRRTQFMDLIGNTRSQLAQLYARKDLDDAQRRAAKMRVIESLRRDYQSLKAQWDGYDGYDRFFEGPLNNARFAAVSVYRQRVPDFERWLKACDGDFSRFYTVMTTLGGLERDRRHERLEGPAVCSADEV